MIIITAELDGKVYFFKMWKIMIHHAPNRSKQKLDLSHAAKKTKSAIIKLDCCH